MTPTIVRLNEILPPRGDRVGVFGQTGTGKTTLARAILQDRKFVVVCDPKRRISWPGYAQVDFATLQKINPLKSPKIIYKPTLADITEKRGAIINAFFKWVFERENCSLYVDELAMIAHGDDYPLYYGACLQQGRELGIEVISGSQRPMWIPQIAMSEAEHVYCFYLKLEQDRRKIEQLASIPADEIEQLDKREFLYAPQDGDIVGPLRLQISNQLAA